MNDFFNTKIEFLKGVGPQRASLLNTELNIFMYKDLLQHYPFRHEDRSQIYQIKDLEENLPAILLKGKIVYLQEIGEGAKRRLVATFFDGTGEMDLLWFKGIKWVNNFIKTQQEYLVFGKVQFFNNRFSIVHPEVEAPEDSSQKGLGLVPVYHTTEKLKKRYLTSKAIGKIVQNLLKIAHKKLPETLPDYLLEAYKLISREEAVRYIHFPPNAQTLFQAKRRLKFEELFLLQLQLLKQKQFRVKKYAGQVFEDTKLLTDFYENQLPFPLTNAQKRVMKEIFKDMSSGQQMNRLLQGDVGSGKTIVAFMSMLIAIGNKAQACLMAPTEILTEQHYRSLKPFADQLDITIDLLTGSTRTRDRRVLHGRLENGNLKVLVGTHALIEDVVQFENLGLCVIDEQHRFGVEQRSRLWKKNSEAYPHILVMTATPIPRTLAMTVYGDLETSVIDEMPKGRKPIKTAHRLDAHRLRVFAFIKEELKKGRQAYFVYPLVEESEKLDYKNVTDGYESIDRAFPEYYVSIVHGQMSSVDKDFEMQRFLDNETQIMVATTVIEVGVNVPNASVMVIENAERFGLAQLHQLRGRVGRGAEQSYCILMTKDKISKESRVRIDTMVRTNNGFEISEVDMQLRGPGNIMGTQQSGIMDLVIADLAQDGPILREARKKAQELLENDPLLEKAEHQPLKNHLEEKQKQSQKWSRIS